MINKENNSFTDIFINALKNKKYRINYLHFFFTLWEFRSGLLQNVLPHSGQDSLTRFLVWVSRFCLLANIFSHSLHSYFVWDWRCFDNFLLVQKSSWQILQVYLSLPSLFLRPSKCLWKFDSFENCSLHFLHSKRLPFFRWTLFIWSFRLSFLVKFWPHKWQGFLGWKCWETSCLFRSPFLLNFLVQLSQHNWTDQHHCLHLP